MDIYGSTRLQILSTGMHQLSIKSLYQKEAKRLWDRFEFIFTQKHSSWLNMAEIELHVLNRQILNRHIETIEEVTTEVLAWQNHRYYKNAKINWQFTDNKARIKLKRLYPLVLA